MCRIGKPRAFWGGIVLLSLVLPAGGAEPMYKSVCIKGVPHIRQKPDFCGEACAAMYLRKLGYKIDQDYVFDQSGLDPLSGRGCWTRELWGALVRIGFQPGKTWYRVGPASRKPDCEAPWKAMHADLLKGIPSIVCMHYDQTHGATEHFRLVLGYDAAKDEVIYHDPAEDKGAYRRMKRDKFFRLWPLREGKSFYRVIRLRLKPGKITKPKPAAGFTNADYAQHIRKLKKKIPPRGFTVVIQRPFVVIGDGPPANVRRCATGTVKWAVDLLKKDYFEKDPTAILDIWLFKDNASYRKHTKSIFNDNPGTPFGYYSSQHKALVMNISTGGGTLVHEICHPFMRANFPRCPSWFDEGLASLYEQCGQRRGHIVGFTNWRLAGLQKAIRAGRVPPFKQLCSTTTRQFYQEDPGTNYGQARYLCLYLQEKGLLVKYYRAFRANWKKDPTGYETLKEILGVKDMSAFKKKWESWVLKLRYR